MIILDHILEQAQIDIEAKQPKLAIKELKKAIKFIKKISRRKSR